MTPSSYELVRDHCEVLIPSSGARVTAFFGMPTGNHLSSLRRHGNAGHLLSDSALKDEALNDSLSVHVLFEANDELVGGIRFTSLKEKSCPINKLGVSEICDLNFNVCEAGRFFIQPEFRSRSLLYLRAASQLMIDISDYQYYAAICQDQFLPLYSRLTTINLANNLSLPERKRKYNLILGKF